MYEIVSSAMFLVLHKRELLHKQGLATKLNTPITKSTLELYRFDVVKNSDIIVDAGHPDNA